MHDHITFLPPAVARGDRWNEGYCYHHVGEPSSYHSQFISPGQSKMGFIGTGRPTARLIWEHLLSVCMLLLGSTKQMLWRRALSESLSLAVTFSSGLCSCRPFLYSGWDRGIFHIFKKAISSLMSEFTPFCL